LRQEGLSDKLVMQFPLLDMNHAVIGMAMVVREDRLPGIIAKTHFTLLLLLTGISATSVFVLFLVLNRVLKPVVRLREGAERIGRGEFAYRIEVASKDEIGELSAGFNRMAMNLERLRSIEERLAQSERLAAVGKFAAGIAHEINNPIGNVIGMAKLMRRNITDGAAREDLETIIKDADRCGRIVKDLLSYSRQSPPRKEPTNLRTLIDDAVTSMRGHIAAKEITFQIIIPDSLPDLFADPLQLGQAIGNILLNAVQSIEGSGTITIQASFLQRSIVDIAVTDTGCGIEDAVKDKIFFPFFTTKAVGEGTGLGLAISYGIIQNHGGEIIVESKAGSGSTFRVRLPAGEGNG
jgi:two-component system NtrC family sensor kinase